MNWPLNSILSPSSSTYLNARPFLLRPRTYRPSSSSSSKSPKESSSFRHIKWVRKLVMYDYFGLSVLLLCSYIPFPDPLLLTLLESSSWILFLVVLAHLLSVIFCCFRLILVLHLLSCKMNWIRQSRWMDHLMCGCRRQSKSWIDWLYDPFHCHFKACSWEKPQTNRVNIALCHRRHHHQQQQQQQ